jgi:hypothetical protein
MATSSFERDFVIKDKEVAEKFLKELNKPPHVIKVKKRDLEKDKKVGLKLLKEIYPNY